MVDDLGSLRHDHSSPGPAERRQGCVLLFADLSGFTALSARLVADDTRGAEKIRDILNPCLCAVIDGVVEHGGRVLSIAGDAVTAAWSVEGGWRMAATAAARCAEALRLRDHDAMREGLPELSLRIGLHAGELRIARVGGVAGEWRRVCGGPVLTWLFGIASGDGRDAPLRSAAFIAAASGRSDAPGSPDTAPEEPQPDGIMPALHGPSALLPWLGAAGVSWTAEFRRVSVLFARFPDALPEGHDGLERLHALTVAAQQVAERTGGTILQLDTDDKGLILLVVWGLAISANDSDPDMAVAAAMALERELAARGLGAGVTVGTGETLAGVLGNASFAQYTVLGPCVNLAAGALEAAGRGILCDEATRAAARRFAFSDPLPHLPKGAGEPVAMYRPLEERRAQASFAGRLVGRVREQGVLRAYCDALGRGAVPGVLWLSGEPGIGKSHLVAECLDRLDGAELRILRGAGDRLHRMTALAPWRSVVGGLLHASSGDGADLATRLRPAFADLPGAASMLPLLSPVLPAPLPETPETLALNPVGRTKQAHEMIVHLLRKALGADPALLVLEDVHWMDTASWQLLAELRLRSPSLGVMVVSRPVEAADLPREAQAILSHAGTRTAQIGPLEPEDARDLIAATLGVRDLPPLVARRIVERTGGHALYTRELAASLRDTGAIRIEAGLCYIAEQAGDLSDVVFPDGIEGTVAARIGQLDLDAQQTLKVASVQGRDIDTAILAASHPAGMDGAEIIRHLDRIASHGLVEPQADSSYRFHHQITRDVAYDLLPQPQANILHEAVAAALETGEPDPALAAHHWSAAGRPDRAVPWLDKAARAAEAAQAHREALDFVQRALTAAGKPPRSVPRATIAEWHRIAGEAGRSLGRYDEAIRHLGAVVATHDRAMPRGTFGTILRTLDEILRYKLGAGRRDDGPGREAPRRDGRDPVRAAEAHLVLGEIHFSQNAILPMVMSTLSAMNLTRAAGDRGAARAWAEVHMAMIGVNVPWIVNGDRHLERALAIVDTLADKASASWVLGVAGFYEFGTGRWRAGREHLHRAMKLAEDSRQVKHYQTAMGGLMNLCRTQGCLRESDAVSELLFASGQDHSVNQVIGWALDGRIRSLLWLNAFDTFDLVAARQRALLSDEVTRANVGEDTMFTLAICEGLRALQLGRDDEALEQFETAIAIYATFGQPLAYCIQAIDGMADAVRMLNRRRGADATVLRLARFTTRMGKALARLYPPARARARLAAGDLAALRGRKAAASRDWRAAGAGALALDMAFVAAMAAHRLADCEWVDPAERAEARAARDRHLAGLDMELPLLWTA